MLPSLKSLNQSTIKYLGKSGSTARIQYEKYIRDKIEKENLKENRKNMNKLNDGFYFILYVKSDIISIISIHNKNNTVAYHGNTPLGSIDEFKNELKSKKIKLISKIPIPKIKLIKKNYKIYK